MFVIGSNSASTGYNLTRSLRFRRSATAYLNRTPSVAGNRQKFTISVWYKAGGISASEANANILNAGGDGSSVLISGTGAFGGTYQDRLLYREGGTTLLYWPMVFRDPASWYHIVFAMDTTQATAANRTKLYVNGVDQGAFSGTAITQNASTSINNTSAHYINTFNGTFYPSDLYYTEYNFVDGQQLTPSSFGSTNALTGVWQPAAYTGSYGTNGFELNFTDNSALTTSSNVGLGRDYSGNGNYWTTNNISITAGVTYDSMTDVPTLTSATAANFAVLNPLSNGAAVPSGGNLNQGASGANERCNSTIFVSSGKWYFEVTLNTAGTNTSVGIGQNNITNQYPGNDILSFVQEIDNARKGNNNTYTAYGTALTANQVFMCAIDLTNLKLFFGSQGTWFASSDPVTGASPAFTLTAGLYCAISRPYGGSAAISINFGQRPFTYTPPTGFVALNTYNLPTSTIVKGNTVMDATLYTGTGANLTVTNAAPFKPDLVWIKVRSNAVSHALTDSVRGISSILSSDLTSAQATQSVGQGLTAFNSNGFSLGTQCAGSGDTNFSGRTYVGWQWQAGQGTTSSNTNGTITSTVSVNASAGFSVVTYTGTGTNGATVGHGLGVTPSMMVFKRRNTTSDWATYHSSIGNTGLVFLNLTSATTTTANAWNNTSPTSSVFSLGVGTDINGSGSTYVAYCWTPIAGFSAFGSYTGNGSADGPFTYLGFRPKWVMIKRTDSANNWVMFDSSRDTYNAVVNTLAADSTLSESTFGSGYNIDFLSNGFKPRNVTGAENASGGTYIYMAFAENPFRNALAR